VVRDLDPEYTLFPWRDPPQRYQRTEAIAHIKDLNPLRDQACLVDFTREWLSKVW